MNKVYRSLLSVIVLSMMAIQTKGQLAGTYSVPATFSTIAAAINSLNIAGVSGTVTILVNAGHTETVPVGGFSMTASGTATSPIIFQKSGVGVNPLLVAYTGGTATPSSALQDGVWRFVGSDYVTINGIDINDPNAANPATMEFGYGFFKFDGSNGCQYNTIMNCNITLNRENSAAGFAPAMDGSRGIEFVNATSAAHTTSVTVILNSGSNSYNTVKNNVIQNCNVGVAFIGFNDVAPYTFADDDNVVGGLLGANSNTIINYGGGTAPGSAANAVYGVNQYDFVVSNNVINNNNGNGINHTSVLRGIFVNTSVGANTSINSNTVTLKGGGTTSSINPIYNLSGSTPNNNTVTIDNNLIANCTYTSATTGMYYGIWNAAGPAYLSMSNNTFTNNSTNATSGNFYNLYNTGAVGSGCTVNNNLISLGTFSAASTSALNAGFWNSGSLFSASLSVSSNTILSPTYVGTGNGSSYLLLSSGTASTSVMTNNILNNLTFTNTGVVYCLYNSAYNTTVTNNSVIGLTRLTAGSTTYGYYDTGSGPGTASIAANTFSNINMAGQAFYGIYSFASSNRTVSIVNNTVSAITNSNTSTMYGMYSAYTGTFANNIISNLSNYGAVYGYFNTTNTTFNNSIFSNTIASINSYSSSTYGLYCSSSLNTSIFKNKIYDINTYTSLNQAFGMYFAGGSTYNTYNNIVGDIKAPNSTNNQGVTGIYINGGTNHNVHFNSVYLAANSNSIGFGSSAIYASTFYNLTLRNNIFINNSNATGTGSTVAYRRSANSLGTYLAASNNNIFYAGTPGVNRLIFTDGVTNFNQTMASFQALVTPRDNVSGTENTLFMSVVPTNTAYLHLNPNAPTIADNSGVSIPGVTDDFDGDVRGGTPDRGADEYTSLVPLCSSVSSAVITPSTTIKCDAQSATLSAQSFTTATGIVYQWQVATNPGGPYTNVTGMNGENYPILYTTNTLSPNTYYYVLLTTCTLSGQFAVSNEATVTIQPYPTITVTPSSATICVPGSTAVALAASGAATYTWLPAAGLNATVGVNVNALPGATTIYTVTGMSAGGCASVTTATITVLEGPSLVDLSATPNPVCSGGNSTLNVLGALTNSYALSGLSYSPIPSPSVGVTTFVNGSVAVTPLTVGSVNDGAWSNIQLPFNFNFYGISYASMAIGTNGYIWLGTGNPNNIGTSGAFPNAFGARPSIAAVYGNLNYNSNCSITMFTTGIAPNRKVVVNWTGANYSLNTGTVTVQAILHETSNNIDIHTAQNTGHGTAIQGIQNSLGSSALVIPFRNANTWTVTIPDAFRWSPSDNGSISYTWTPGTYLTGTNIPTPAANSVTSSVTYTAIASSTNGCTNSGTLALVADITPTVAIAGSNSVCTGNTVNLTASGAVTYSWSNGATGATVALSPSVTTIYTVVGTTSLGCTDVESKTITVNNTPTVSISGPTVSCGGSQINLVAAGAATYSWNTGSTLSVIAPSPTANITYSVVGTTTAGCSANATYSVLVYAKPTVTITAPSKICIGQTVTIISTGQGVDSYSWNTGAQTAIIAESPTTTTAYTVTVKNNITNCVNTGTVSILVDPCVGLEEVAGTIAGLSLYPNPNNGSFSIQLDNNLEKNIEISDLTGRVIFKDKSSAMITDVNISELANGVYYVKISSDNNSQVFRVVKQ